MAKPRTDLKEADATRVREAWDAYRQATSEAERRRRELTRLIRRLSERYPVSSIARAAKVTPPAVWNKLRP